MSEQGWIGVDLDGTLAYYDQWRGDQHIGKPILPMIERVKQWLREGKDVRIFTARVYQPQEVENGFHVSTMSKRAAVKVIEQWCLEHIGQILPITNIKDFDMVELWDDRAVQVIPNTGHAPLYCARNI